MDRAAGGGETARDWGEDEAFGWPTDWAGGVVDRSRVSPCPTRVGKECDPNKLSLLPLSVGPTQVWSHASWTV
jgi:hypothetical protein